MTFKRATKEQAKLRLALFGVSGGGKTYSALRLATGLGGKIALIDTEHGSASKYADRFNFDVCELEKATVNNLLLTMEEAKDYDVLIIDSLTHSWNELLQEVDKIAKSKYGGNSWSGWSDGNKKQNELINAILTFPGHLIATMRAETNWTTTVNDKGKVVPVRIGEAPKQGKQIEFEFDMLMQISQEHQAVVLKDRTGKYQDECFMINEQFGKDLLDWLQDGGEVKETKEECISITPTEILETSDSDVKTMFKNKCIDAGLNIEDLKFFAKRHNIKPNDVNSIINYLKDNDLEKDVKEYYNV